MTFARGTCVAPIFLGLFHARPKGDAHFLVLVTGACFPRLLMGTSGLALKPQRGAMEGVCLQMLL